MSKLGVGSCLWPALAAPLAVILLAGCSQGEQAAAVPRPAETGGETTLHPDKGFAPIRVADCDVFYGKGERTGQTWTEQDGIIRCTGTPRGYLYTNRTYRDFTLRCDFRFLPPDDGAADRDLCNTGFLIYVTEPHKLWPVSLEVQGRHDQMAAIKANGGAAEPELRFHDESARRQARRPVGEWNSVEILSRDGALIALLNGTRICESRPTELKEGRIALQSEGFAVEFRNVRVREDQAAGDQPVVQ